MMFAIVDGDIVTGLAEGNVNSDYQVPDELINNLALRFDGDKIVDANSYNVFFVDAIGIKHIVRHEAAWQSIECSFGDALVLDGGIWRLRYALDNFLDEKAAKLTVINTGSTQALLAITNQYTREEIDSWPVQEAEAKEWAAAPSIAETPLIDAIVSNRPSVDKDELVSRILANATTYKMASGAVIGKKQAFEDALNALDPATATQADIDAIEVVY